MVSAVILSYNRCPEVLLTIDKLKSTKATLPFELEIVVVDNASLDDTSARISQVHPDVVLVTKPKNNGIAGWNEGFKIAKHKYFLVLDDDSHVHSGLAEAIEIMEHQPNTGILAMQIVDKELQMDPDLDPSESWKDGDLIAGFIGCGAIIRKELYKQIGGFADWIYLYTHEFEYGMRCLAAGYQIRFFGRGIVVHRVSSINRVNHRMRLYATRNELEIIDKYFSTDRAKYLTRVLLNNLKFVKKEGIKTGYYILKGAWQFLRLRKKIARTPVSQEVQDFFATNFWSTKPAFMFINRKINKIKSRLVYEH